MTLKYTLDEARQRETAHIGTKGVPAAWWGYGPETNDCLGYQLWILGLRSRNDYAPHYISISAFRTWAGWDEVAIKDVQAGDLVCEEWPDKDKPFTGIPGHIEYVYSAAEDHITIISANTGPTLGHPRPRGVWKKVRDRDEHLLFAIRPPYRDDSPSRGRKAEVRTVAGYVNRDNVLTTDGIPKTYAETDGIEGPIYWRRVQQWGRDHGLYGPTYIIDGIPGPRTRVVEAAIYAAAKKAAKA